MRVFIIVLGLVAVSVLAFFIIHESAPARGDRKFLIDMGIGAADTWSNDQMRVAVKCIKMQRQGIKFTDMPLSQQDKIIANDLNNKYQLFRDWSNLFS